MNWGIFTAVIILLSGAPASAFATTCANPAGNEGDQLYNTTYNVMQYCNGTNWIAMGSHSASGDGLGDHTAGQALDMGGFRIQNLAPPTADNHAVTRAYVTSAIAAIPAPTAPNLSAVLATGNAAGNRKITGLAGPTANTDAATKKYVDDSVAGSGLPACPAGAGLISTGSGWDCAISCENVNIGQSCGTDGAIYIGEVTGNRIFAAPADEPATLKWDSHPSMMVGADADSLTDGLENTTWMATHGAYYSAALACATKAPAGTWYLPAKDELALLWNNGDRKSPPGEIDLTAIGIHASSEYWSSTESSTSNAWVQQFSSGTPNPFHKSFTVNVRCVRR